MKGLVSRPVETLDAATEPVLVSAAAPRRNHVGTISLVCAVTGMVACRVALTSIDEPWLRILAAGFEAATVGGARRLVRGDGTLPPSTRAPDPAHRHHHRPARKDHREHRERRGERLALARGDRRSPRARRPEHADRRLAPRARARRAARRAAPRPARAASPGCSPPTRPPASSSTRSNASSVRCRSTRRPDAGSRGAVESESAGATFDSARDVAREPGRPPEHRGRPVLVARSLRRDAPRRRQTLRPVRAAPEGRAARASSKRRATTRPRSCAAPPRDPAHPLRRATLDAIGRWADAPRGRRPSRARAGRARCARRCSRA